MRKPATASGYTTQPRGFNRGEPPKPHRARKGRQTENGENMRLPAFTM
jgi:hypothetical protein